MTRTDFGSVDLAKILCNYLLAKGVIENIIKSKEQYDPRYTNARTDVIIDLVFKKNLLPIPDVQVYKPKAWRFSRALATTYTGNYNYIGLNYYKLNRSVASICGSIAHEWGHCLEYRVRSVYSGIFFNHGDNSPVGKQNTFQYYLGKQVKYYVERNYAQIIRDIGII